MALNIPLKKMLLLDGTRLKPLLAFDYGDDLYHVVLFDFGDDGGAIGIVREGDNFCARITLDSLVEFNRQAQAQHIDSNA